MSKRNNKDKYQMKSKFTREESLSDGMENTDSDNTIEKTGNEYEFRCELCKRNFYTNRGLIQHLNTCRREQTDNVLRERFYCK